MSLHYELHGPHQNLRDWYNYVTLGATTIHKAAPDFLVLVSSLNYDTYFTFLKKKPLDLNLDHKLVYETHLHSWSQADRYVKLKDIWKVQPVDRVCATFIQSLKDRNAFLREGDNAAPMFVSEFGFDQTFTSEDDTSNKFLTCFLSYLANEDLDWALWAYPGSYYYREGQPEVEDVFGVVDADWKNLRYPEFPQRFQLAQKMIQGMKFNEPQNLSSLLYAEVNFFNEPQNLSCPPHVLKFKFLINPRFLPSSTYMLNFIIKPRFSIYIYVIIHGRA